MLIKLSRSALANRGGHGDWLITILDRKGTWTAIAAQVPFQLEQLMILNEPPPQVNGEVVSVWLTQNDLLRWIGRIKFAIFQTLLVTGALEFSVAVDGSAIVIGQVVNLYGR